MKEALQRIARELGLPLEDLIKYYKAYWKFIRTTIEGFELKADLTQEDYDKLRVNFNIPFLGKLACPYSRQVKLRQSYKDRINGTDTKRNNTDSK